MEIAYDLCDLNRLHESLLLISRARAPLSTDVWLNHLKFAVLLTSSEQDISKLIELFKRATENYFSIYIALELASIVKLTECKDAQAQEIWSLLIPLYAYEFTRGREILVAYREDIIRREPDSPERVGKIFETFRRELGIPLRDLHVSSGEFDNFFTTHGNMLPSLDMNYIRADVQHKTQIALSFEPFEAQLDIAKDAINLNETNEWISETQKGLIRAGLEDNNVKIYCKYIAHCTGNNLLPPLPPEGIMVLYERMIAACPAHESAWKTYLTFLFNLIASGYNSSLNFCKTIFDVIERGLRQSRPVQHAVKSAILNALIHCNMTPEVNCSEILLNARTLNAKSGEDMFANIIIAYLAYLITYVNNDESERQFEDKFDMSYRFFVTIHGGVEDDARSLWASAINSQLTG